MNKLMQRHNHGNLLFPRQRPQYRQQLCFTFYIQKGGRLVQQQNFRLLADSAGKQHALALPISAKNVLRAAVLRNMLQQVFRNAERGEGHDHV